MIDRTKLLVISVILCFVGSAPHPKHHKRNVANTLELVHVIFRHGDRTPDESALYPNDPHINDTYYPIGLGQLTNAGKMKEYMVGKALRKKYRKFLGKYNIATVDARSTNYNRTKTSLQLVLASLFPPEEELVWTKKLKWQPVPFNYWSLEEDMILGDKYFNCPKFRRLYHEYLDSPEGPSVYKENPETLRYISKNAGYNLTSGLASNIYFTLTTELENGRELPAWTKKVYPDYIRDLAIIEYKANTATPTLNMLNSGFLVKKIVTDTKQKMLGRLGTKMFLYSAHESNIAHLLRFLNVYYPHIPPYGSYLSFEIHKSHGNRSVKIYYQDYSSAKPKRLVIPGCDSLCHLDDFVAIYAKMLPENEKICFK